MQGYPLEVFVDKTKAENFVCAICLCVPSEPVQTNCDHVFCNSCISSDLLQKRQCPLCRTPIPANLFITENAQPKNILLKSTIDSLHIQCTNSDLECQWKGAVKDLSSHLSEACAFVSCPLAHYGCTARRERFYTDDAKNVTQSVDQKTASVNNKTLHKSLTQKKHTPMDEHMQKDIVDHFRLLDAKCDETQKAIVSLRASFDETNERVNFLTIEHIGLFSNIQMVTDNWKTLSNILLVSGLITGGLTIYDLWRGRPSSSK